jgi:hypothetical protein
MKREEFRVGTEFWCEGTRWRCIDVGSRVVVAENLDVPDGKVEHVFHEYDLAACTPSPPAGRHAKRQR